MNLHVCSFHKSDELISMINFETLPVTRMLYTSEIIVSVNSKDDTYSILKNRYSHLGLDKIQTGGIEFLCKYLTTKEHEYASWNSHKVYVALERIGIGENKVHPRLEVSTLGVPLYGINESNILMYLQWVRECLGGTT